MSARVDGECLPSARGDGRRCALPRMAGLSAAMQEDHGRLRGIAAPVADKQIAVATLEPDRLDIRIAAVHANLPSTRTHWRNAGMPLELEGGTPSIRFT